MSAGNTVTLVGNITRDPELRFTPSGQANCRMGLAVNRRWQDKASGEWKENTSFFDVISWGQMAENVGNSLKKGARVLVTGRLEQRSWEDKDSGQKRYAVEIIADEIGPSLRWATASVERIERQGGGGDGGGGEGGNNFRQVPNEPAAYDDFGDEPF
jgi:single-strand DNA-binding protein